VKPKNICNNIYNIYELILRILIPYNYFDNYKYLIVSIIAIYFKCWIFKNYIYCIWLYNFSDWYYRYNSIFARNIIYSDYSRKIISTILFISTIVLFIEIWYSSINTILMAQRMILYQYTGLPRNISDLRYSE